MRIWLRPPRRRPSLLPLAAAVVLASGPFSPVAGAGDWPQWRGPTRDGRAPDFDPPAAWPEALTRGWSTEVGLGYATPLLRDGRMWVFARQGEDEVLLLVDPATGETLARGAYNAAFHMSPATERHGPGPKSTPALADGRVFVHGMTGSVSAFDAATAERLWHVPGTEVEPLYHTSMSPLVMDDRVIVHVGGHDDGALTAFSVEDGTPVWQWDGDGPAYGSPMLFELDGEEQIVTFTQEHFVGVLPATGELLWRIPFTTPSTTTSQTPLLHGGLVIQTARDNGVAGLRVGREGGGWTTEDAWRIDTVALHMANPVMADGVLYGLSHRRRGQYFALDLDAGTILWESRPRQADNASLLLAGGYVLSLQEDGELVILETGREAFREVARYELARSPTWTAPALVGNTLYVKDIDTLTTWTIE